MSRSQALNASGKEFYGHLALPPGGQGRGLLLLPAWWGLNDFFAGLAERLAAEGFSVLAVDLYHGEVADSVAGATKLRKALDTQKAKKELAAAVDHLSHHAAASSTRLGAIGFSMGARLAYRLAEDHPANIAAVVAFYGVASGNYGQSRAAFQGHYAESDEWGAHPEAAKRMEKKLSDAGLSATFYHYPNTEHWFFEEDVLTAYDPAAAKLAWERCLGFLKQQLQS